MMSSAQRSSTQTHSDKVLGNLVAGALSGAWREALPRENPSQETLALITPLLYASGSAALGWWRIREVSSEQWAAGSDRVAVKDSSRGLSALRDTPGLKRNYDSDPEGVEAGSDTRINAHKQAAHRPLPTAHSLLHDAYRRSRLKAIIHEQELKYVLLLLRTAGIEPVLVKGWAIARRYPDRALRPYGDIDLCIRPDQFKQAEAALKCLEGIEGHYVDLHYGFAKLNGGRRAHRDSSLACGFRAPKNASEVATLNALWSEWFDRSQLVDLGEDKVRVLCEEDHLRVLCLHLLRSGAWRPLWLCDIALAVETRGPNFDWQRCLGADPLLADWVACTIGLAHRLLGVDVSDTPVAERARNLPNWLVPAVLRQWGRCRNPDVIGMAMPALARSLTAPNEFFKEIYARWDQPVRATAELSGSFNNWSRLPYQLAELLTHSHEVPKQLGKILVERWQRPQKLAYRTGNALP